MNDTMLVLSRDKRRETTRQEVDTAEAGRGKEFGVTEGKTEDKGIGCCLVIEGVCV